MAASGILFFEESQRATDESMTADTQLAQVLEHAPSRGDGWDLLADGRQVRPVLSFHSATEGWCREYMLAEQGRYSRAVACKGEKHWFTAVITPDEAGAEGASNDYRAAGANDSDEVQRFVDTHADGIALSADKEAELIARGWK